MQRPEILAPAGDWACLHAAIENGADAIYFGLERFNARMRAENFQECDLPEIMAHLHRRGVRGYVTLNTLVFANEIDEAVQYLQSIIRAGVDAIIVQDVGLCRLIRQLSPDFPIHASTQMTITSVAGVQFAQALGCQLVVLARECSISEIHKIKAQTGVPLEVFVHGALCVAYSGQCLTSEALGGRSANRGECAQACRMPYELLRDGNLVEMGQRNYLLSPQDLAGIAVLPALVASGVHSLKIEGRLKQPEYVAAVTRVYREALDRVVSHDEPFRVSPQEQYTLEMSFSRGLSTGWFEGINNQTLVHGQYAKKRGVYLGTVTQIYGEQVYVALVTNPEPNLKLGDGVVFSDGVNEQGGALYGLKTQGTETILIFGRGALDTAQLTIGTPLWKTSDPHLERTIRQTYRGEQPKFQRPIELEVHGQIGTHLAIIARDLEGTVVRVESTMPLIVAHKNPLTSEKLREQLGRLGGTAFKLGKLTSYLVGEVLLPVSELNTLRRELVTQLDTLRAQPKRWQLQTIEPKYTYDNAIPITATMQLIPLVRSLPQLEAALNFGSSTIYCELEDPRRYRDAVVLAGSAAELWVAPPRITKPGEEWILQQVLKSKATGYLIRNYDQLRFFQDERGIGDFSLNVANPWSADYFMHQYSLERLTASYDLNMSQLAALLTTAPPPWFEVTIHQHMPMFHMEHCVFCAFLSTGTDHTNCGRPCEQHQVQLKDRAGIKHTLKADSSCRNTLYNGRAQTGAEYVQALLQLGLRHFRIEFLDESPSQVHHSLTLYDQLLHGKIKGSQLWRELKLQHQLGVTRGQMAGI